MVLITDAALAQQHRKIPAHFLQRHKWVNTGFSVPMVRRSEVKVYSLSGSPGRQQVLLPILVSIPRITAEPWDKPLGSSVVLLLSQSVELILDQTIWQSGSEVIRTCSPTSSDVTPSD